jgi:hypothetical protein
MNPPLVIWLLPALRQLCQARAAAYIVGGPPAMNEIQDGLTARLRELFPGVTSLVVLRLFSGFRPNPNRFIVLIEVTSGQEPARYIVKLDGESVLRAELDAWHTCRPIGLHSDPVLMMLSPLHDAQTLGGLRYADAQQFIGGTSCYLEDAFLDCVLYGNPLPSSLAEVFSSLLGRLAYLLYGISRVEDPRDPGFILDIPCLLPSLESWQDPANATNVLVRQNVNTFANARPGWFRDPVDYLSFVHGRTSQQWPIDRADRDRESSYRQLLVPRMLRGCAHGDLHGRNVLVGVSHDRARWPAVFDYEHMSPRNLLVWDFVKLETELKIRAYPHLFENEQAQPFIAGVQKFEVDLAEQTQSHYDGVTWPAVSDEMTAPLDRLRALLLVLRRLAATHLGQDRERSREWLDEWYFAQACYGVHVGRFGNLERSHLIGAFVSAGVATARFLFDREDQINAGA